MKTIIVDDNELCLSVLVTLCERLDELEIVGTFLDPVEALAFSRQQKIDLAILDIEMPEMSGIELGQELRKDRKDILLVYVSTHEERYVEAVKIKADRILVKPVEHEDIEDMLFQMKLLSRRFRKDLRIQMFGRFQIFVKDKALKLQNEKARELLALCMDHRGGKVSMDEACTVLWENKVYDGNTKQLYRKAVRSLRQAFAEAGIEGFFLTDRGCCYIDKDLVDCDYFKYVEEKPYTAYSGEYLYDYDWAEQTLAMLENGKIG